MANMKVDRTHINKFIKSLKNIKLDMSKFNIELTNKASPKIKKLLKLKTPKDTGETADSWKINKKGSNGFIVENDRGDIIEFLIKGVKPHRIDTKDKSALFAKIGTGQLFAKFVDHPGYSKQMDGPALFRNILKIVEEESGKIINKSIKKRLN